MGLRDAVDDDDEVVSYAEPSRIYKKLIVRNDKLVGAISSATDRWFARAGICR